MNQMQFPKQPEKPDFFEVKKQNFKHELREKGFSDLLVKCLLSI